MSFLLISIVRLLSLFHINDANIIVVYYYVNVFIKMRDWRVIFLKISRVNSYSISNKYLELLAI